MAPIKRPASNQKTKDGTKRPRLIADASKSVEASLRTSSGGVRTRSSGPASFDIFSPNISSSEFSDPGEDEGGPPKNVRLPLLDDSADDYEEEKDGDDGDEDDDDDMDYVEPLNSAPTASKTPRQKRAARRLAERAHAVDLTDDEAEEKEAAKAKAVVVSPLESTYSDGWSPRERRANRRRAEQARRKDLTDDEADSRYTSESAQSLPKTYPADGAANINRRRRSPSEERASLNLLDDDDEADNQDAPKTAPSVPKTYPADGAANINRRLQSPLEESASLDLIGDLEDDEPEYPPLPPLPDDYEGSQQDSPEEVEEAGSDSNADAEGETDVEEPIPSAEVEGEGESAEEDISPAPSAIAESEGAKKPVQLEDFDFTTGAAARYIEFMKKRGHSTSDLFGSRQVSVDRRLSSSSSSSSGSEGAETSSIKLEGGKVDDPETTEIEMSDGVDANDGEDDDPNYDNDDDKADNFRDLNKSYLVYRRDKTIDSLLSGHLRAIAKVLNFMVRARASGIDVGDFEALAAVPREAWADLVETPEYAADVVVKNLLELSIWDICILSERAATLRDELEQLGVSI